MGRSWSSRGGFVRSSRVRQRGRAVRGQCMSVLQRAERPGLTVPVTDGSKHRRGKGGTRWIYVSRSLLPRPMHGSHTFLRRACQCRRRGKSHGAKVRLGGSESWRDTWWTLSLMTYRLEDQQETCAACSPLLQTPSTPQTCTALGLVTGSHRGS